MAKLGENSLKVLEYLQANDGKNMTAADIAEGLGISVRSVNGCITSFVKKELMVRVEATMENEDQTTKTIKLIELTDKGRSFDPNAVETNAE